MMIGFLPIKTLLVVSGGESLNGRQYNGRGAAKYYLTH